MEDTRQLFERLSKLETQATSLAVAVETLVKEFAAFRVVQDKTYNETRATNGRVTTAERNILDLAHTIDMLAKGQLEHTASIERLTNLMESNKEVIRDHKEALTGLTAVMKNEKEIKDVWRNRMWNSVWTGGTIVLLWILYATGIINPPRL
jgi:uncharacterized protein (UPF0335 family)